MRSGRDICWTAWGRNNIFVAAAWRICCKIPRCASMPDYSKDSGAVLQLRLGWRPNARFQPLPEAGAERTLLAVGCKPLFGEPRPSLYGAARFWTPLSYAFALCPTTHRASFGIRKPPSAVAYGRTAAATARQIAACSGADASASMARVLADVA